MKSRMTKKNGVDGGGAVATSDLVKRFALKLPRMLAVVAAAGANVFDVVSETLVLDWDVGFDVLSTVVAVADYCSCLALDSLSVHRVVVVGTVVVDG